MEYQFNQSPYQEQRATVTTPDTKMISAAFWFSSASLVLTLLIIFTFSLTMIPAIIGGALGILFAVLSKGKEAKMKPKARNGAICAIVSLSINVALIAVAIYLVTANEDFQNYLKEAIIESNEFYEENYGVSLEEMYPEYFEILNELEP